MQSVLLSIFFTLVFFFFKQKTAYEMRISDWSSDVCSSDLKTGQFISADPNTRYETIQWVMWQMGGVGPMFGQVGFFHKFAGKAYEDKRPRDRYATESARLLGVLDERLAGRDWVMGADYSIVDI